jgi:predicted nucleic acid-binding protein
MGRVVRFSEFDEYLYNLKQNGTRVEGTILDANVIITLSYSPKKFHTRTYEFIKNKIQKNEIALYTTVNTTQEYLEFYRRLLLTEGLRTATLS